jgi:hypothetical protein
LESPKNYYPFLEGFLQEQVQVQELVRGQEVVEKVPVPSLEPGPVLSLLVVVDKETGSLDQVSEKCVNIQLN